MYARARCAARSSQRRFAFSAPANSKAKAAPLRLDLQALVDAFAFTFARNGLVYVRRHPAAVLPPEEEAAAEVSGRRQTRVSGGGGGTLVSLPPLMDKQDQKKAAAARKADLAAAVAHQVSTARLGKRTLPSIADAADGGGEAPSPKKARA